MSYPILPARTPGIRVAQRLDHYEGPTSAAVVRVVVEGDGDLDVHLLLGDRPRAEVLTAGLRELAGSARVQPATEFADAGITGLRVEQREWFEPGDQLSLRLPSFEITAEHDLLEHADLFGLASLTDPAVSHLPRLSPVPLYVQQGSQRVLARFFAEGFEAAAVGAFDMGVAGALPPDDYRITAVDVTVDRPFGFLAVHRPSGLAVVAGWVAGPFGDD